MSILSLHQVSLSVGGRFLLDAVDWHIQDKAKIALVGRNGVGKSSLLQLLLQQHTPDKGTINRINGLQIAGLSQTIPADSVMPAYSLLVQGLKEAALLIEHYLARKENNISKLSDTQTKIDALQKWDLLPRIEMVAQKLSVNVDLPIQSLSGGMKRRALLACALIAEPDLLLLDEPTNHLDLSAIEWLESYMKNYSKSVIVITHDRSFLSAVATEIVELDRGKLITYPGNFETFLNYREARRDAENKENALFDKRLALEETWLRQGIKARRTRNEGRVRALKKMREAYRARRMQMGKVEALPIEVKRSGHIVCSAETINFQYKDKPIITNFSLLITKGDKLGIMGPNGCGKTTLIRLLLGELLPSSGTVELGTNVQVAYFDQMRASLDDNETVLASVADGSDFISINNQQKHVASYLKEFLFEPSVFNKKVGILSGGERNRLLLAKLFAKPVNLLVMDEPTNDLDIETLELLESKLVEYTGTLILISHDRSFVNEVVTSLLVWEEGQFQEYVGDYNDYLRQKKEAPPAAKPSSRLSESSKNITKLSYNEQRELSRIPSEIEKLETKMDTLQQEMSSAHFYQQEPDRISEKHKALAQTQQDLNNLYERWQLLEAKQNG